jgi:hypothetical protein
MIIQVMLPNKRCHWPFFRSLDSIFVSPANTDSEFPVATTLYTEIMDSKEVVQSRRTTCFMLSCPPLLYGLKREPVPKKSLG